MKKLSILLMASIMCIACVKKAEDTTMVDEPAVVIVEDVLPEAEVMPEFPGGMGELMQYLSSNIKYPSKAVENQWEGRALCQFVIEKDGSISNAEIIQSSGYQLLDVEAMRVVLNMPNWSAGMQNGDSVRVKFTLPIIFKLQ